MATQDMDHVIELERELQSPDTRANAHRLAQLLSPDFIEIGASGRRWDARTILALLSEEASNPCSDPILMADVHARSLTDDLIQVFWDSMQEGRRARRTSLWQRTSGGWVQIYHQGTPLP